MKTPRTQIAQIVADDAMAGVSTKRLSREVAAYLLSEGRISELASLLRDVQADWADAGYVEVLATSAHPLSAGAVEDIKKQIKKLYPHAKRIIVGEIRDPNIIGGVRLNLANQQLDLSFEAKLNKFKQLTIAGKD
ncbi:MAG TPA: F0F1 ATP synthase subunit delta [Candidatus Saccharimonadales bacterium]|nr:F0F1 ATP synthase subunit delta [Candidatus Saccharimonadales bacterium]